MVKRGIIVTMIVGLGVVGTAQAGVVAKARSAGIYIAPGAAAVMRQAPRGTCAHNPTLRKCGHIRAVRMAPTKPAKGGYWPGAPCIDYPYRLTTSSMFGYLHAAGDARQWCNSLPRSQGIFTWLSEYWLSYGNVGWHPMKQVPPTYCGVDKYCYSGVRKRCTDPGARDWSLGERAWFVDANTVIFAQTKHLTYELYCS